MAGTKEAAALRRREQWQERELLILREMSRLLERSLEPGYVIREALHLLSELVGLNRGRVLLPDHCLRLLCIRHAYGLTVDEVARGQFMPGEGISGRAFQSGEAAIVRTSMPSLSSRPVRAARTAAAGKPWRFLALPLFAIEGRGGRAGSRTGCAGAGARWPTAMQLLRVVGRWIAQIPASTSWSSDAPPR